MAPSRAHVVALVVGMLVSGCANSLFTKYQDNQCVANCDGPDSERVLFEQPVFQTVQMFVAEASCWIIFKLMQYQRTVSHNLDAEYSAITTRDDLDDGEVTDATTAGAVARGVPTEGPLLVGKRIWLLGIPSICDICGTTLMNMGLLLIPVSIYQMMRGTLVLLVGLMSITFLKHRISRLKWFGLTLVTLGVFLVGLSAALDARSRQHTNESGPTRTALEVSSGLAMIVVGQVFLATQFVVEEHILGRYSLAPIKVVAWEGTFGSAFTIGFSAIFYTLFLMRTNPGSVFNLVNAVKQAVSNPQLITSGILIMFSIATFNYCGLSVTRVLSATSRSTIDTSRTLGIWVVSLFLGWEHFSFVQLCGFGLLVYGTLLFNNVIHPEPEKNHGEEEALRPE